MLNPYEQKGLTRPPLSYQQPTEWENFEINRPVVFSGADFEASLRATQPDFYEQNALLQNSAQQLRTLQQHFLFVDSASTVKDFLGEEPSVFSLLTEAIRPLKGAFGENRILHVRIQNSDDDRLLRVTVQLPADFQKPENALEDFDTDWWLSNCHRSGGGLVFDYEIRDGV